MREKYLWWPPHDNEFSLKCSRQVNDQNCPTRKWSKMKKRKGSRRDSFCLFCSKFFITNNWTRSITTKRKIYSFFFFPSSLLVIKKRNWMYQYLPQQTHTPQRRLAISLQVSFTSSGNVGSTNKILRHRMYARNQSSTHVLLSLCIFHIICGYK